MTRKPWPVYQVSCGAEAARVLAMGTETDYSFVLSPCPFPLSPWNAASTPPLAKGVNVKAGERWICSFLRLGIHHLAKCPVSDDWLVEGGFRDIPVRGKVYRGWISEETAYQ